VVPVGRSGPYTPYTAWSPRGTEIVHTGDGLWIVDLATRRTRRLTPFVNAKPSWSPDGKVIAGGRRKFVVLVRVKDGKIIARFPKSNIERGDPSWSPRGDVAFVHEGNCGIDVAHEDGSQLRRATRTC
jgi:Tol biopolymer transport system component